MIDWLSSACPVTCAPTTRLHSARWLQGQHIRSGLALRNVARLSPYLVWRLHGHTGEDRPVYDPVTRNKDAARSELAQARNSPSARGISRRSKWIACA